MSNTITKTFRIPHDAIDRVRTLVENRAKIARRLKLDPPTMTVSDPFYQGPEDESWLAVDVTVTFNMPDVGEYVAVGAIEYRPPGADGKCVNVPHVWDPAHAGTFPAAWLALDVRHDAATCTECNVRRLRNRSIVLRDRAGELHLIGESCVKKFTGAAISAASWQSRAAYFGDLDREFGSIKDFTPNAFFARRDAVELLSWLHRTVTVEGFVPRHARRSHRYRKPDGTIGVCSAERARWLARHRDEVAAELVPTDDDEGIARVVVDWVRETEPEAVALPWRDYHRRLRAALHHGSADGQIVVYDPRDGALVASALTWFAMHEGMPVKLAARRLALDPSVVSEPSSELFALPPAPRVSRPEPGHVAPGALPGNYLAPVDARVSVAQARVTRVRTCRNDSLLVFAEAVRADGAVSPVKFFVGARQRRHVRELDEGAVIRITDALVRSHGDSWHRNATVLSVRNVRQNVARIG